MSRKVFNFEPLDRLEKEKGSETITKMDDTLGTQKCVLKAKCPYFKVPWDARMSVCM